MALRLTDTLDDKGIITLAKEFPDKYVEKKQTSSQLAEQYNCSIKTIQRRLDRHSVVSASISSKKIVVLMDTTYWGRNFGVMLFMLIVV